MSSWWRDFRAEVRARDAARSAFATPDRPALQSARAGRDRARRLPRALACIGQVLFALNERYLINEKGALREAARFPLTIANLTGRAADVWRHIGNGECTPAHSLLRTLDEDLRAITDRPGGN